VKLVPYPKYKDSPIEWLGKIPEGWEVIPLRRIGEIVNGSTPESSNEDYWDGDIAWLTPDDLGKHHNKYITDSKRKITYKGYVNCGTTIVPKDSLILSTRAPIGHLALSSLEVCFNQGCRGIIFQNNYSPSFYYYYFSTLKEVLNSYGQGTTFFELGANKLASINVVIPSLREQTAIADFLDQKTTKIDELIKNNERLIELLKEKRQAIISHAVTKGIPPHPPLEKGGWGALKMKDSGIEWIGEIPEGWSLKRLKYVCTKYAEYGLNIEAENYQSDGIRFIRTTDIDDYGNLKNEGVYLDESLAKQYVLNNGDLLISRSGTIGRTFLFNSNNNEKATFAGYLVRFSLDKKETFPKYIFYFTQSHAFFEWIRTQLIETTIGNVNAQKYANLFVTLPAIKHQTAIANYLDQKTAKIDGTIKKIQSQIETLKEYRQTLISNVVTGKVRVN
jgi:type I restriction enzyme, S subunit